MKTSGVGLQINEAIAGCVKILPLISSRYRTYKSAFGGLLALSKGTPSNNL